MAKRAPLGLMGFGMTTILLTFSTTWVISLWTVLLLFCHGHFLRRHRANFCWSAGVKKGNTFSLTAFTSYGSFWLTLVAILLMPKLGLTDAPNAQFLGVYLGLVVFYAVYVLRHAERRTRSAIRFSLTVLFALLAIGNIAGNAAIIHFAGWIAGLICGASAIYLAMGEVLNEQFGRTVLPIGESH
ncbi:acetate uptake transporter [Escherichia coli]